MLHRRWSGAASLDVHRVFSFGIPDNTFYGGRRNPALVAGILDGAPLFACGDRRGAARSFCLLHEKNVKNAHYVS